MNFKFKLILSSVFFSLAMFVVQMGINSITRMEGQLFAGLAFGGLAVCALGAAVVVWFED